MEIRIWIPTTWGQVKYLFGQPRRFIIGVTGNRGWPSKRFPHDYSHRELADLVQFHHQAHVDAATEYNDTLEKLKEARIELSKLKRNK
jgi:hypothetical protein